MKTKKKVFVALLSIACLTASAIAFTACGETADTRNPDIVAVYNMYVASAEANGETPLTYDAWLASVKGPQGAQGEQGKQGEQGEKGDKGLSAYELYVLSVGSDKTPLSEEAWLASLKGDAGKGVKKAELNADGTKLIITYTDDTTDEIDAPKEFHKHTYGDDVITLIESETGKTGLGYQTCTEASCGHVELVIIEEAKPYTVTVKDTEGEPVEGVTLELIDPDDYYHTLEEATTDEDGVATFEEFGKRGNYFIITSEGEYTTVGLFTTNKKADNYEVTVALSPYDGISEAGIYAMNVGWAEEGDGEYGDTSETPGCEKVTFIGSYEHWDWYSTKYIITVDESVGKWKADAEGQLDYAVESEYVFYLAPGATQDIYFTFDYNAMDEDYNYLYDKENYPYGVSYIFTVKTEEGPAQGSLKNFPFTMSMSDNSNTIETEDGSAWYVLDGFEVGTSSVTLTFNESVSIQYQGTTLDDDLMPIPVLIPVQSGEPVEINQYGNNYFVVTTTDEYGEVSFNAEANVPAGYRDNPVELTLGTAGRGDPSDGTAYFQYTATENKTVLILAQEGTISSYFIDDMEDYDNEKYAPNFNGFKFEVEQDKVYYILMQPDFDSEKATLLIKEYDAATDKGYSAEDRIEITLTNGAAEQAFTNAPVMAYYEIKELPNKSGTLTVTVVDGEGNEITGIDWQGNETSAVTITYSEASGYGRDDDNQYTGGGSAYVTVSIDTDIKKDFDGSYTIKIGYTETNEED